MGITSHTIAASIGGFRKHQGGIRLGTTALLFLALGLAGCAGGNDSNVGPINPNLPVGLPPAPAPASGNAFTATQGPGLWFLSIDDAQEQFSYQAMTYPASPNVSINGTFAPVAGFLSLTGSVGAPAGYAVEVPGRALFVNPGGGATPPLFAVQQDSCFPINGNVRFQFVTMPNPLVIASVGFGIEAYGSIEAQTSADGNSWMFGSQEQYVLPYTLGAPGVGSPIQPGTTPSPHWLQTFNASCKVTDGRALISAGPNVSSTSPVSKNPTNFVVGPTGFFFEDQSAGGQASGTPDASTFIGVIEPSAPLSTANIVAPKYVGFVREAGLSLVAGPTIRTQPIGFGQIIAGSESSITGGTFLNDDITQFQNSNIIINFGKQDPANNGLYSLASITVPDPANVCFIDPAAAKPGAGGTPGVDQFGNATCTFNAVAVVGNPENKYAIFISSFDVVNNLPMGVYLFQQP